MFLTDFDTQKLAGFYDIEYRRMYGTGSLPLSPDEVPVNFPFDQWNWQAGRYLDYWSHFTGFVWTDATPDEKDEEGKPVLRYPLQINLVKTASMKQAYVLMGESPDTEEPLVPIRVLPRKVAGQDQPPKADMTKAEEAELFVNEVWMQNSGRSLMQEAALMQQFLGGCVFRVNWAPDSDGLEYGIRIENVVPDFFLPVWDSGRPDHLLEAWVIYRMQAREAAIRFGLEYENTGLFPLYVEHWTPQSITITIAGKPVTHRVGNRSITYDNIKNPFGCVPFVYIPRERAGSYYGISLVDDTKGVASEYNARMADIGDLIRENAHRDIIGRNINKAITTRDIGLIRPVIDLGVTPSVSKDPPEIWTLDASNILSSSVLEYPKQLLNQFYNDSFMSKVAYGEDEGSQRSALTLAFRMWPLTSKTRAIRTFWTSGLINIARIILKVAAVKEVGDITEEHLQGLSFRPDWPPMIPRDREQLVDETVAAVQTEIMSPVTAIELLGYTPDPVAEANRVKEYLSWKGSLATQQKLQTQNVSPKPASLGEKGAPFSARE